MIILLRSDSLAAYYVITNTDFGVISMNKNLKIVVVCGGIVALDLDYFAVDVLRPLGNGPYRPDA